MPDITELQPSAALLKFASSADFRWWVATHEPESLLQANFNALYVRPDGTAFLRDGIVPQLLSAAYLAARNY